MNWILPTLNCDGFTPLIYPSSASERKMKKQPGLDRVYQSVIYGIMFVFSGSKTRNKEIEITPWPIWRHKKPVWPTWWIPNGTNNLLPMSSFEDDSVYSFFLKKKNQINTCCLIMPMRIILLSASVVVFVCCIIKQEKWGWNLCGGRTFTFYWSALYQMMIRKII